MLDLPVLFVLYKYVANDHDKHIVLLIVCIHICNIIVHSNIYMYPYLKLN